jgi:hypothetical protein
MVNQNSVTFVCCVESGVLEEQTIRLIESIRRWGGTFSSCPVIAVSPRFSLPLKKETKHFFSNNNVQHITHRSYNKYSWNNFLNKPLALVLAEQEAETEYICWLDSDLIMLSDPDSLIPPANINFASCPPLGKSISVEVDNNQDENIAFWSSICKLFDIQNLSSIPFVYTRKNNLKIYLYFNSGVFIYQKHTKLANIYFSMLTQILAANIAHHQAGIFFHDQVALALAVIKSGISFTTLPLSHNYSWSSHSYDEFYDSDLMKKAKIFHYHDAMYPPFWSTMLSSLEAHPEVLNWLENIGPIVNNLPIHYRILNKLIKWVRTQKKLFYIRSCKVISPHNILEK